MSGGLESSNHPGVLRRDEQQVYPADQTEKSSSVRRSRSRRLTTGQPRPSPFCSPFDVLHELHTPDLKRAGTASACQKRTSGTPLSEPSDRREISVFEPARIETRRSGTETQRCVRQSNGWKSTRADRQTTLSPRGRSPAPQRPRT